MFHLPLLLILSEKDFAGHKWEAEGSFLELLFVLWETAFALWGSCVDGMYSFPPGIKVKNSGGKPKRSGFQDHPCLLPRCTENPSLWKLASCELCR